MAGKAGPAESKIKRDGRRGPYDRWGENPDEEPGQNRGRLTGGTATGGASFERAHGGKNSEAGGQKEAGKSMPGRTTCIFKRESEE